MNFKKYTFLQTCIQCYEEKEGERMSLTYVHGERLINENKKRKKD
jgi:hypothetical protein